MKPEVTSSVQASPPVRFPTSSETMSALQRLCLLIYTHPGQGAGLNLRRPEFLTPLCLISWSPTAAAFLKSTTPERCMDWFCSLWSARAPHLIYFWGGDKSSQNQGNTSAAAACRIITRHWAAHCCLRLLWPRQNSFLTSHCFYWFYCRSCGWDSFTNKIKIPIQDTTQHAFINKRLQNFLTVSESMLFWWHACFGIPFQNYFSFLFFFYSWGHLSIKQLKKEKEKKKQQPWLTDPDTLVRFA